MNKYSFSHNGKTYARISKAAAKKAYLQGFPVVMTPCNLRPFGPWEIGCTITKASRAHLVVDDIGAANDFCNLVNSFEYYNCAGTKTGKYAAFYIVIMEG